MTRMCHLTHSSHPLQAVAMIVADMKEKTLYSNSTSCGHAENARYTCAPLWIVAWRISKHNYAQNRNELEAFFCSQSCLGYVLTLVYLSVLSWLACQWDCSSKRRREPSVVFSPSALSQKDESESGDRWVAQVPFILLLNLPVHWRGSRTAPSQPPRGDKAV